MPRPSVLIVAHRILPARGGLAVATDRIARLAVDRNEEVQVLAWDPQTTAGMLRSQVCDGLLVHRLGLAPSPQANLRAMLHHAKQLALSMRAQLIHGIYASQAGYVATLAALQLGIASVVSMRGNDVDEGLLRPEQLPFVKFALERASVVTGVSSELCRTASALSHRDSYLVGNSVDPQRFAPREKDPALLGMFGLGEDPVLGFSGELREKKGMAYLLPAFAKILEAQPCHLLLIGGVRAECQPKFEEFQAYAPAAAHRIKSVLYARDPQQLCQWLSLCDLMVFPSLQEGMPNAVLEAMACERPVLATKVGGHRDIIDHGRTGALLDVQALDELPEAILEFLRHPEREAIGKQARAHVVRKHSVQAERQSWSEIYQLAREAPLRSGTVHTMFPGPL